MTGTVFRFNFLYLLENFIFQDALQVCNMLKTNGNGVAFEIHVTERASKERIKNLGLKIAKFSLQYAIMYFAIFSVHFGCHPMHAFLIKPQNEFTHFEVQSVILKQTRS